MDAHCSTGCVLCIQNMLNNLFVSDFMKEHGIHLKIHVLKIFTWIKELVIKYNFLYACLEKSLVQVELDSSP